MKRYIKVTSYGVFGQDEITREDLARVKNREYEAIIDTQNNTYFDAETNIWKEIQDLSA